jgi:hypothetical protein
MCANIRNMFSYRKRKYIFGSYEVIEVKNLTLIEDQIQYKIIKFYDYWFPPFVMDYKNINNILCGTFIGLIK